MAKLKMTFYYLPKGVEFSVTWADEGQYRAAKRVLDQVTGGGYGVIESDPDRPDYYLLETEEQLERLRELRQKSQKAGP